MHIKSQETMRRTATAPLILLLITLLALVPCIPVKCSPQVSVGAYYYVWYDEGLGNRHWNSTPPNQNASLAWNVVDTPLLGYYSSQNESVISQHLDWMKDLGLDFLIISWWGPNSYEDNSTRVLFETVKNYASWMKLAIMFEGFSEPLPSNHSYTDVRDYLFDTYIYTYSETYMKINGKPLICWSDLGDYSVLDTSILAIHGDSRVEARIVGYRDYCDWLFNTPWSGSSDDKPGVYKDNEICIEPRYDDTHIGGNHSYDPDYSQGLYDEEWNEALNYTEQGQVKILTICSWNQFHTRSQIEPHTTNGEYPLSVFSKTKSYIDQIRSSQETVSATSPLPYIIIGIPIGIILMWLYYRNRARESYIKEKAPEEAPSEREMEEDSEEEAEKNEVTDDSV